MAKLFTHQRVALEVLPSNPRGKRADHLFDRNISALCPIQNTGHHFSYAYFITKFVKILRKYLFTPCLMENKSIRTKNVIMAL